MADGASDRPLRVLVLTSKPAGLAPSQRFRFEQWAPLLARDHGIVLDPLPFESPELTDILYKPGHVAQKAWWTARDFLRRSAVLRDMSGFDAILVHREAALLGPAIYERLIAWRGTPLIFDFDDAIWMRQPEQKHSLFSALHFHGKTRTICRLAKAVCAGNEFLADYARTVNDNVHVVPTTIDLAQYRSVPEPPKSPFVVCWTGSTTTLPHFEHARPALEEVARRIPLVVKVICNRPPDRPITGAEMRFVPWSAATEAREIGDSHVGIMPLPDNAFSRGKCGLKALQCMAAGRPVIISPVGVNASIVEDGVNGFLASSDADFVAAMEALAKSSELRARMGAAARKTVEARYSGDVGAARCAAAIRSAV